MKAWEGFAFMGAIYLSPHVSSVVGISLGIIFVCFQLYFSFKDK